MICMLYKFLKKDKSDPFYITLVHQQRDFLENTSLYMYAFHNLILNIFLTCTFIYRLKFSLEAG